MTKTIALAITASLVGSASFAGQNGVLLPGDPPVELKREITVHMNRWAYVGSVKLKHGDRYLLLVQDASPKNGPIGDASYKAFNMKLTVKRYYRGSFRWRDDSEGVIDPGTGSQIGLEFIAGGDQDNDDPRMPVGSERWFEFYVSNLSRLNKGPVKITVHNITPTIGLPPVGNFPIFDVDPNLGFSNVEEMDEIEALEQELVDELDEE